MWVIPIWSRISIEGDLYTLSINVSSPFFMLRADLIWHIVVLYHATQMWNIQLLWRPETQSWLHLSSPRTALQQHTHLYTQTHTTCHLITNQTKPSACVIKCYNRCYANPSQRTTSWLLNFVVNLAKKPIYNRRRQHLFQIHVANRLFPLTDLWICICILSFFQRCYSWPRANQAVQTSSKKNVMKVDMI